MRPYVANNQLHRKLLDKTMFKTACALTQLIVRHAKNTGLCESEENVGAIFKEGLAIR
jgi:hypothetical protein